VRRPLLRFTLLGALLFALDLARPTATLPLSRLEPSAGAALEPSAGAALDDDALLVREALARDLHRSDDVVRRRLVQNLRFARPADGRSDDALVEEAIALGLHESDLVVQRRLAQKMRLLFAARARASEPSEAELRAYLAANAARFTEPERVALTQLYFRDRARAESALSVLAAGVDAASLAGDALPLPRELPSHARDELAARLGPAIAEAAFAAPAEQWVGPVASPWGQHLLFVRERTPARRSAFETVRTELREALLAERAEAATRQQIAALRVSP
jgi:parvulin-like peptidyl-prolyl isomerase